MLCDNSDYKFYILDIRRYQGVLNTLLTVGTTPILEWQTMSQVRDCTQYICVEFLGKKDQTAMKTNEKNAN